MNKREWTVVAMGGAEAAKAGAELLERLERGEKPGGVSEALTWCGIMTAGSEALKDAVDQVERQLEKVGVWREGTYLKINRKDQ